MRISAVESDPGFIAVGGRENYVIFLDGVEQFHVVTADTKLGYIARIKLGDDGEPVVVDDEMVIEELRGVVRIELRP